MANRRETVPREVAVNMARLLGHAVEFIEAAEFDTEEDIAQQKRVVKMLSRGRESALRVIGGGQ